MDKLQCLSIIFISGSYVSVDGVCHNCNDSNNSGFDNYM